MTLRGRKSNRSFLRLIRYVSHRVGFPRARAHIQAWGGNINETPAAGYFVAPGGKKIQMHHSARIITSPTH